MKTSVSFVALAASASATFLNAPAFPWPGNIDNVCTPQQLPGFNWADLDFGDFFNYKDFIFKGWKCEDATGKRSRITPRTFGKVIGGICHPDKFKSPSFGCGPNLDKFSLGKIVVQPEFDTDLEFHYDMPDGSVCKHRSKCSKKGTTIVNNQCGGAKNVTIIYPPQPNKPKPTCSIKVPTISFDCSTASSTKPPKTTKTSTSFTSTSTVLTTTSSDFTLSTTISSPDVATSTSTLPGDVDSTTPVPITETSTGIVPGTSTTDSETSPVETTDSVSPTDSTSVDVSSSTESTSETTGSVSTETPVTTEITETLTITTSFQSTSTIFTTSTQTITQCEPTKTDCPGNSVTTVIVTIPVSTTICPVTETLTTTTVLTTETSSNLPVDTATPSDGVDTGSSTSADVVVSTSSGVVSSVSPVPTLDVPELVPRCLNTFIFTTGCSDNTDAACYCPDAVFVKNVYDCMYAHGTTDAIIAEAIAFFQGICGKYLPQNPGIATDATVTSYITVTATPSVAPISTTVTLITTTVVPCTDEAGSEIPSSSTTVTISTSIEVPQVDFTSSSTDVVIVPITSSQSVVLPTDTGIITPIPTDTTSTVRPTQSIVTAGSGKAGVSLGFAAAVAAVAALAM
ncbi:hypothetical protein VTJ04DRAFT_2605 [Mycothermus thermophilus]|uniref:uncharacterized protein n=1 Tax=Humicola insolens TaxID=85995 RepID=UPI0037441468